MYTAGETDLQLRLKKRRFERALRLNREPRPLTALAASTGDLGARAVTLLAVVAWPGNAASRSSPH
jgi:hypothetical protein